MDRNQRVLWSEGMFLSPHHFQQWDRFAQWCLQFRLESISRFNWGFTDLEISRDSLVNGQFSLVRCSGVLPGGAIFNVSENDTPLPAAELRSSTDPSVQTVNVYLALAADQAFSCNVMEDGEADSHRRRYVRVSVSVADESSGDNECQIAVMRPNLQLLVGEDATTGYDHLQVARLRQESSGSFALDESFIPPCLHISSSLTIVGMMRRLLETLHSKSASLSELRTQRSAGMLEYANTDLGNLWLLHTVNSAIPVIDHCYRVRKVHPEALFLVLAQLAGALMAFSPSVHPRDLPHYDHNNLAATLLGIEKVIQESLKAVVPTGAVEIPLDRESDSKFTAHVADGQLLAGSQVFLAAGADVPDNQLIEELPKQAKISSIDMINSLLGLALPGVALIHSPIPPHPLRVKLGLQYFRLESRRDAESQRHWDQICQSRTIAIRVPGHRFPALKLQLWSIKE